MARQRAKLSTTPPLSTRYPPLPKRIMGPGGWVSVKFGKDMLANGKPCIGTYGPVPRCIMIDSTLPQERQWSTLYHELGHVALFDSGISNLIKTKLHEAICDAIETQRMRERFG